MDGVEQLDEILPIVEQVVDGISPDQLQRQTACAGFTVEGVLEHMIAGATSFAPAFRGEEATAEAGGGSVRERWRRAMADLLAAVHSPGAQERTVSAPFGEVPGSVFARFVAFDGLVHGWDLATATGQPYSPPDNVVREVDTFARQALTDAMREGDTFAVPTDAPSDASPMEQLVAFTGRQLPRGATS